MRSFFRGFRVKHMIEFKCALLCDGCLIMVPRDHFHNASPALDGCFVDAVPILLQEEIAAAMILTLPSFLLLPSMKPPDTMMSGRPEVIKDFTTPDRSSPSEAHEEKKELSGTEAHAESTMMEAAKPKTVTPAESTNREELFKRDSASESPLQLGIATNVDSPTDQDKHVRFNRDQNNQEGKDSPASSSSQRGLVSRRGGRCGSPGRIASKPPGGQEPVLEFKTFRSPPRKRDENDTVPSLCSTSEKAAAAAPATKEIKKIKEEETSSSKNESEADRKPLSISCDSSKIETTSPLQHNGREQSHDTKASRLKAENGRQDAPQLRKNNVTFSPVPPKREDAEKVRFGRFYWKMSQLLFWSAHWCLVCTSLVSRADTNKITDSRAISKSPFVR